MWDVPGFSSGAGGQLWGPPGGCRLRGADRNPARSGAEVAGGPCAGGRGTKEAGRPPPAGLGPPRRPRGAPQVVLGARGRGEEEEQGAVLPLGCPPCLPSQGWGRGHRLLGQVLHGDLLLARDMEGNRLLLQRAPAPIWFFMIHCLGR